SHGLHRLDLDAAPLRTLTQARARATAQTHRALRDSSGETGASRLGLCRTVSRSCRTHLSRLHLRPGAEFLAHALHRVHFVDEITHTAALSPERFPVLRWLDPGNPLRQHEAGPTDSHRTQPAVRRLRPPLWLRG